MKPLAPYFFMTYMTHGDISSLQCHTSYMWFNIVNIVLLEACSGMCFTRHRRQPSCILFRIQ